MDKVFIYDTTLRDGEQCPGASMNTQEKLEVARQLARLNVDVIEAGFPISSPGDFESVKLIASEIKGPSISGLCRALKKDIDRCWEAVKYCKNPTLHIFIATSDIHLKHKLKKTREEALKQAVEAVALAKSYTEMVEFSAEDFSRSDPEYLVKIVDAAIEAGATTVNLPDTVGYAIPEEFAAFVAKIMAQCRHARKARFSVHCHNDLGLAVSNSLAAVKIGARQVECTINGIGERAGNASLEEVVMGLKTRQDYFNLATGVNTKEIMRASRLVSNLTGMPVQFNKAIVGRNAFAHESGIHQDGVIKHRQTYEIMDPADIGLAENQLILGKHSGRAGLKKRLNFLGVELDEAKLDEVYEAFKKLSDRKKDIFDDDLLTLLEGGESAKDDYGLKYLQVSSGTDLVPQCVVRLEYQGRELEGMGKGDGPVDAIYKTIADLTKSPFTLVTYTISAITGGTDAQGDVTVVLEHKGRRVSARGAHTDVLVASAKAYLAAINKMLRVKDKKGLEQGI